jgi:hypothetical protein
VISVAEDTGNSAGRKNGCLELSLTATGYDADFRICDSELAARYRPASSNIKDSRRKNQYFGAQGIAWKNSMKELAMISSLLFVTLRYFHKSI